MKSECIKLGACVIYINLTHCRHVALVLSILLFARGIHVLREALVVPDIMHSKVMLCLSTESCRHAVASGITCIHAGHH